MEKTRVITVIGTRPEIIRLSRVMVKCDKAFSHTIVHTGQNYDYHLNKVFFEDLGLRSPDVFLEAAGDSPASTIARIIERVDVVYRERNPDAVLILGDTNSCLAAIPAKKRRIPIFHMEAGNRCFDDRVPEEANRRLVDHIADINMPYSSIARGYLIREGFPEDRIIKTGSPMREVLTHYMPKIRRSRIRLKMGLKRDRYFVVSCHREENVDSQRNFDNLVSTLNLLAAEYRLPIVMTTHPRTRKRIEASGTTFDPLIRTIEPLGLTDYVRLQMDSRLVLSDSGTITEESSILNFPALNIREAHERPEGMEEGAVIMCGLRPESVLEAARIAENQPREGRRLFQLVEDYGVTNVSDKVIRIIKSYIDYVNWKVWKK